MPSSGSKQLLHWLFVCTLVLESLRHAVSTDGRLKPKEDSFVIAGYLPEYRFYININNTAASLTDLILFSMAPDNQGQLSSCCLESQHFEQARQARAYKKEHFPGMLSVLLIRHVHTIILANLVCVVQLRASCLMSDKLLIPSFNTCSRLPIREGAIKTMDVYWWSWAKQLLQNCCV